MKKILLAIFIILSLIVCFSACASRHVPQKTCSHKNLETIKGTPPTCVSVGVSDAQICKDCSAVIKEQQEIKKLSHDFEVKSSTPACTSQGSEVLICKLCKKEETKTLPAGSHALEATGTTVPATCTTNGGGTYKCKNCDYTETKETPALGHLLGSAETIEKFGETFSSQKCTRPGCTYAKATITKGSINPVGEYSESTTALKYAFNAGDYALFTTILDVTYRVESGTFVIAEAGDSAYEITLTKDDGTSSTFAFEKGAGFIIINGLKFEQLSSIPYSPDDDTSSETDVEISTETSTDTTLDTETETDVDIDSDTSTDTTVDTETETEEEEPIDNTLLLEHIGKGHSIQTLDKVDPTCTEVGLKQGFKCEDCDLILIEQKEIPALGHKNEIIPAIAPTCINVGYGDGVKCSTCGVTLHEPTLIMPLGHTDKTVPGTPATCTETGLTDGTECSVCGVTTKEQETIGALGHKEETLPAVTATCTATGLTEGTKCSVCNTTITAQETTDKIPHDMTKDGQAKAPTCTEVGWDAYKICSVCGYDDKVEISALDHDEISHDAQAPTCTTKGWNAYKTCSRCDYTTYNEIDTLGHDIVQVSEQTVSCTENGFSAYEYCTRCSYSTMGEVTPMLGHSYTKDGATIKYETTSAPTCISNGYEWAVCDDCGYNSSNDKEQKLDYRKVINATGEHDFTVIIEKVESTTCTEPGYIIYGCSLDLNCDATYEEDTTAAHTNLISEQVPPTCRNGYTEYYCLDCREFYADNIVPATGMHITSYDNDYKLNICYYCDEKFEPCQGGNHNMEEGYVIEPSCSEGYTFYYCTKCYYNENDIFFDPVIPEHNYVVLKQEEPNGCEEGYILYICKVCNHTYSETIAAPTPDEHDYYYNEYLGEYVCKNCYAYKEE